MRIALLNMYSGWVDRGAETFVHELAQKLSAKNKVTVFQGAKKKRGNYLVEFIDPEINWRHREPAWGELRFVSLLLLPLFLDYWNRKVFWFTLRSLPKIWRERFDIVIPVNGGWMPALIRLLTWIYGGKMVISGQAGIGLADANNLWSFPDAFVGLSRWAKSWAKKVNPFVRAEYIPNGADLSKFKPEGKKISINLKKPIVLFAGALEPGKRILETIKAAGRLKNASLLVAGEGILRHRAQDLGEKLLSGRFKITKFPYEMMPQVYRVADVFTIPSKGGYAFEIVLVEAMAANLPVVANDDPIRKEIVGSGGLLVNPEDTETYAKTLGEALKINWGNKPRRQAEKFSWDKIAEEYERLFRELVHGK